MSAIFIRNLPTKAQIPMKLPAGPVIFEGVTVGLSINVSSRCDFF